MTSYALSFLAAAQELAQTPEAQDNWHWQCDICAKHGIYLNLLTQDECDELSRLVEDFAHD